MRDLIDAPDLDAFADNDGSTFTVRSADDAELVLDEVDTQRNTHDDWERFTLLFHGPSDQRVDGGIHRLDHSRLGAFDTDLRPTHVLAPDSDARYYQSTFTRHVPNREPNRPYHGPTESRRGFFGRVAAALGGIGILGGLMGSNDAEAAPGPAASAGAGIASPTTGQIAMFGGTFAPFRWAFCNGQELAIADYQALYSLLGTTYGGDGRTTFRLPDLRGRVPMHASQGHPLGESGGAKTVSLDPGDLPSHNHAPSLPVSTQEADARTPDGHTLGVQPNSRGTVPVYDGSGNSGGAMTVDSNNVGSGNGHENLPPYTVVHFIIALDGTYPSR